MGVVEDDKFIIGTKEILNEMVRSGRYTIIGGGHTIMTAKKLGLIDKITHASTGGRAFLQFLTGEELPALKVLKLSKEKFKEYYRKSR